MQLVPLFPLQIVVFPFEDLNLHIFEPRYRELVHDCREGDLLFGIPYFQDEHPMQYGTMVRLERIAKTYPDGKMDVVAKGVKPFEIQRYRKTYPEKLYPGGYVTDLYWEQEGDSLLRIAIRERLSGLYEHMNIQKWPDKFDEEFITFEIAHKVGLSQEQEYAFLQIVSEVERQQYIIDHLDRMVPMIKEAEDMRKKVQMNGHFKHILPPKV
ncbi:MAG: LON peptidase substrate-binding domain-containing protein [Bacteroidota bacterium]